MNEIQEALAQLAHDYSEGAVSHQYVPDGIRPMDEWDHAAARHLVEGDDE